MSDQIYFSLNVLVSLHWPILFLEKYCHLLKLLGVILLLQSLSSHIVYLWIFILSCYGQITTWGSQVLWLSEITTKVSPYSCIY